MGKDLKGKELGANITQRKDKKYLARFTDKYSKRHNFTSFSLRECQKWLSDSMYADEHSNYNQDIMFDIWYGEWYEHKKRTVRKQTLDLYDGRYKKFIKNQLGNLLLKDIKLINCQKIIDKMIDDDYSTNTLKLVKAVLVNIFEYAIDNEIIDKNSAKKISIKGGKKEKKVLPLSVEEQIRVLESLTSNIYYTQFCLLLQTGMRISELIGLEWDDIDFEKRIIRISKQLVYYDKEWRFEEPKSETSERIIPLTDESIFLLKMQRDKISKLKTINIRFKDCVFLNKNGNPIHMNNYDAVLRKTAKDLKIKKSVTVHVLRHTFATRCIEAGLNPKFLQDILGHADIGMTMNRYVSTLDDEKIEKMLNIQGSLKVV